MNDPYTERRAEFYRSVLPNVPPRDVICAYRSKIAGGDYCYIVIRNDSEREYHWRACDWKRYRDFMLA